MAIRFAPRDFIPEGEAAVAVEDLEIDVDRITAPAKKYERVYVAGDRYTQQLCRAIDCALRGPADLIDGGPRLVRRPKPKATVVEPLESPWHTALLVSAMLGHNAKQIWRGVREMSKTCSNPSIDKNIALSMAICAGPDQIVVPFHTKLWEAAFLFGREVMHPSQIESFDDARLQIWHAGLKPPKEAELAGSTLLIERLNEKHVGAFLRLLELEAAHHQTQSN